MAGRGFLTEKSRGFLTTKWKIRLLDFIVNKKAQLKLDIIDIYVDCWIQFRPEFRWPHFFGWQIWLSAGAKSETGISFRKIDGIYLISMYLPTNRNKVKTSFQNLWDKVHILEMIDIWMTKETSIVESVFKIIILNAPLKYNAICLIYPSWKVQSYNFYVVLAASECHKLYLIL